MITGEVIDVKNYRSIPRYSYSSLKLYVENRKKFYKEEVLGEKKEKDETDAIRMGNLVDVLLTDEDNFDEYFIITTANKPTGQLLTFTDFLFKYHKINLDEEGNLTISTDELFNIAYGELKQLNPKLRDSLDTYKKNFNEKAKDYYIELYQSKDKTVLTLEERQLADKIVYSLKTSENTKDIVNKIGYSKYPILFNYRGVDLKSEIDKFFINHEEKYIEPFDFKCTAFLEGFLSKYLEFKYYLQQALYRIALRFWANNSGYKDYEVKPMSFVAFDSINYYKPLIYKMTEDNYRQGLEGFIINGRKYDGVNKIIDDIKYSEKNNIWDMSADNARKNGIVEIPVFDEYKKL